MGCCREVFSDRIENMRFFENTVRISFLTNAIPESNGVFRFTGKVEVILPLQGFLESFEALSKFSGILEGMKHSTTNRSAEISAEGEKSDNPHI